MELFGPVTRYGGYNDGTGPSPLIIGSLNGDPMNWITYAEDFVSCKTLSSTGVLEGTGCYVFLDSGDSATQLVSEVGGVIRLATDSGDNDAVILTTGYNVAGMVKFTAGKALIMECRIRPSSVTTVSYFFGLAEEGLAGDNGLIADAQTAMVDKDFVGFRTLGSSDADTIDAVYRTDSGSGEVEAKSGAEDLEITTWYKLGLIYKPDTDQVIWLVDGVPVAGQTRTAISATDFPDGEELAPYIGMKNAGSQARNLDVDWLYVAMER